MKTGKWITFMNKVANQTWDLYMTTDGRLLIHDTEPRYGGWFEMFKSVEEANNNNWFAPCQDIR